MYVHVSEICHLSSSAVTRHTQIAPCICHDVYRLTQVHNQPSPPPFLRNECTSTARSSSTRQTAFTYVVSQWAMDALATAHQAHAARTRWKFSSNTSNVRRLGLTGRHSPGVAQHVEPSCSRDFRKLRTSPRSVGLLSRVCLRNLGSSMCTIGLAHAVLLNRVIGGMDRLFHVAPSRR